jgi:hypothetical protein
MYDLAHGFWNLAKNVSDLVSKSGKMHLKPARKDEEIARGRFTDLPTRPPWDATPGSLQMVAEQLMVLKVPVDWPANPPFGWHEDRGRSCDVRRTWPVDHWPAGHP